MKTEKPDAVLRIRRVRPEDIPEIWELHRGGMNQYRVGVRERVRRERYPDLLNPDLYYYYYPGEGELLAVEYDGQIIGMGGYTKITDRTCELVRFSVARPFQGSGVGRLILKTIILLAAQRGFTSFILQTSVRQDAAKFYEKEGFEDTGIRTNSPRLDKELRLIGALGKNEVLDLISMRKDINPEEYLRYFVENKFIYRNPRISITDVPEIEEVINWESRDGQLPPIPRELLENSDREGYDRRSQQQSLKHIDEERINGYIDKMISKLEKSRIKQKRKRYQSLRRTGKKSIRRSPRSFRKTYSERVTPSPEEIKEIRRWANTIGGKWMEQSLEDRERLAGRLLSNTNRRMGRHR